MPSVNITGYGDDLSVNGIRIGDLSPAAHESIEKEKGGRNYAPLENAVVSHVKDSSTLIVRKPDPKDIDKYIESEIIDEKLAENATKMGDRLVGNMNAIKGDYPDKIKEVRGRGLLTAFEMHNEPYLDGHAVSVGLLDHGVYAKETHHSTVRLAPALTINESQIDILSEAIRSVVKSL